MQVNTDRHLSVIVTAEPNFVGDLWYLYLLFLKVALKVLPKIWANLDHKYTGDSIAKVLQKNFRYWSIFPQSGTDTLCPVYCVLYPYSTIFIVINAHIKQL